MTVESIDKDGFKLCECGECGELIPVIRTDGKPARFKHGHNKGHHKGQIIRNEYIKMLVSKGDGKKTYKSYHRIVWEEHYQCCILPWIDIHHKDGDKTNNDISNLEPLLHNTHTRLHWEISRKFQ